MKVSRNSLKRLVETDTIFSAAITTFFLFLFIATFSMKEVSTYLLPRVLAATGTAIGISALIVKFMKSFTDVEKKASQAVEPDGERKGLAISYSVFLTIAYFFLAEYLGFILSTFISIVVFSILLQFRNKLAIVIVAIVVPIALHYLFVSLLKVKLPEGILLSVLPF